MLKLDFTHVFDNNTEWFKMVAEILDARIAEMGHFCFQDQRNLRNKI